MTATFFPQAESHAPAGYTFLFQCVDAKTHTECRRQLTRIFGTKRAGGAQFVPGVYPNTGYGWHFDLDRGFMAFVPKGGETLMQFHFVCLGCKKLLKHPICTDCGPKAVIDRLPETKQAFRAGAPLGGWAERKIYGQPKNPVDNGKPAG